MKVKLKSVVRALTREHETGWAFALIAGALYVAFLCWAATFHEFWRDEIHPWALARTADSFWDIVTGDRVYDGHPPLWYWYLRVWSWVTTRPWGLHAANVVAMGLAGVLFLRYAPIARPIKILLLGSYLLGYEYGTLARNYTATWAMLTIFCSTFHPLRPRFVWLALFLGMVAITSVFGALMACGLALPLIPLGMSVRLSDAWPRGVVIAMRPRFALGAGILLASLVFFVYSTAPPGPNPYSGDWNFDALNAAGAPGALRWIVMAMLPIRAYGDPGYWGNGGYYWGAHLATANAVSVALLVLMVLSLVPGWWEVAGFTLGILLLAVFQMIRYGGGMRHLGNFFLLFMAMTWIRRARAPRRRHVISTVLLLTVGIFQVKALLVAVDLDRKLVFSGAGDAAAFIEKSGRQDLPIVAGPDAFVLAVTGHLHRRFISSETDEVGETMVFHGGRRGYSDAGLVDRAVRYAREKHTPVLVLANRPLPAPVFPPGAEALSFTPLFNNSAAGEESFWIYQLGQ